MSSKRKASRERSSPSKKQRILKEDSKRHLKEKETEKEKKDKSEKHKDKKKEKDKKETEIEKEERKEKKKSKDKGKDRKRKKDESVSPRPKSRSKPVFNVHRPLPIEATLFACGTGDAGQLGLGPNVSMKKFATPILNSNVLLCDIKAAYMQTALVVVDKSDNTQVYTWGCNDLSAAHVLGRDGEESEPHPVPLLDGKDVVQVSVGQYHMTALTSSGKVYFWGSYKADEFIGPNTKKYQEDAVMYPELHPDLIGIKVKQVTSAGNFTCAITENGELLEWGWTRRGQCDRIPRNTTSRLCLSPSPLIIKDGKPQKMVCGHVHGIVFVADTKGNSYVASWGFNHHGQLGHGDKETRERPTKIEGLPKNVVMISCGEFHNIALTEDHKVYAWGRNSYYQIGNGDDKDVDTPQHIAFFDNLPENGFIVHVACGSNHSFAVTNTGHVYGWGFGDELQLGNGEEDLAKVPTLIKSSKIPTTNHCISAVAGSSHSIFVTIPKIAKDS